MESKIKNIVIGVNYFSFLLLMVVDLFSNAGDGEILMLFYLFFLSAYSINTFFFNNSTVNRKKLLNVIAYFVQLCLAAVIVKFDSTSISIILYLFIMTDIVVNYSFLTGIVSTVGLYAMSVISVFSKQYYTVSSATTIAAAFLPVFCVMYIIYFLINYLLKQNDIIKSALKEVSAKKLEKDALYNDLKAAYERVEAMTSLKERNRIAREIHDTVGHTLTTVLVEIEASKRLLKNQPDTACEKLDLAQGQVRKGLNDIRSSVRVLENGEEIFDFFSEVQSIITDTEKHSGIIIKAQMDTNLCIGKSEERVILSALTEGLTNGIKHGKSTAFLFKLYCESGNIVFSLENNGKSAEVITPGFGLRAMRERVTELGGKIDVSSASGQGFSIYITIPIKA